MQVLPSPLVLAHGSMDLQWICSLVTPLSHWYESEWREVIWHIYSSTLFKNLFLWWLRLKGRVREDAPFLTAHLPWLSSMFGKSTNISSHLGSRVSSSAERLFYRGGCLGQGEDAVKHSCLKCSLSYIFMSSFPNPFGPCFLANGILLTLSLALICLHSTSSSVSPCSWRYTGSLMN